MKIDIRQLQTAINKTAEGAYALSSARSQNTELIESIVREAGKITFIPSSYWDTRTDLSPEKARQEAVCQESFGIDYLPDGDSFRTPGFVTAVRWDPERETVIVDGIEALEDTNGVNAPFSTPLEWVEDNENIIRFIGAFAEGKPIE